MLTTLLVVVLATVLWRSGLVRDFVAHWPWAREKIEQLAEGALMSRLENLGRLGYFVDDAWTPLSAQDLTRRRWTEGTGFLDSLVSYEHLSDGVRVGALRVRHEKGAPFDIVITEVDSKRAQLRVLVNDLRARERAFVKDMVAAHDAIAAINAGFFDDSGALGLVLRQGATLRQANGSRGYLVVTGGRPRIVAARSLDLEGIDEAIQCSPLLMTSGEVFPYVNEGRNTTEIARRSAVAITYENLLLLVATDVEVGGLTMQQLTTVLAALGARSALALDGGASTQLYMAGRDTDVVGWDPVPVALGVFPAPNGL